VKLQDISNKFRTHLRAVKGRLSGSETGEEQQRFDIDRIIRLHCEAELVKLTALVELAAAKGESTANSQYVTVLDFDYVAEQKH
jgi:hypothetical protein